MTNLSIINLSSDGTAEIQYPLTLNPANQFASLELFGRASNVVVKDQEGNLVKSYLQENLKEVEIDSSGLLGATLYYNTSDLTKKSGREWTFDLISPIRTSIILPNNSLVSSWGMQNPLMITQSQNRNIITFDQGNITVRYSIVEPAPTKDEAIISIDSTQVAIQEIKDKNPGIRLTDAEKVLQQAISAKDSRQYQRAIDLGNVAKALVSNITKEYDGIQSEIKKAELLLTGDMGGNSTSKEYESLLTNAKNEFTNGSYAKSKDLLKELLKKYNSAQYESGGKNLLPYTETYPYTIPSIVAVVFVVVVVAVVIAVAVIYVKYKKNLSVVRISKTNNMLKENLQDKTILTDPNNFDNHSNLNSKEKDVVLPLKDSIFTSTNLPIYEVREWEKTAPAAPATGGPNIPPFLSMVERAIGERPHLKHEDKQVLRFIAEKGGTAFESEIRNKFILPKTTLWRLVKRLERENLVMIRKAGVQNLIELRYDNSEDNGDDQNI